MYVNSSHNTQQATSSAGSSSNTQPEDADNKKIAFSTLLVELQKINENLAQGLPADYDKTRDSSRDDIGQLDEDKNAHSRKENDQHGMNRIRAMLASQGFEPENIDAYLQAMNMPDLQGAADGDVTRQQEQQLQQQAEELEEQQRLHTAQQSLTAQHSATASMTGSQTPEQSSTQTSDDQLMDYLLGTTPELTAAQTPLDSLRSDVLKMRSILG